MSLTYKVQSIAAIAILLLAYSGAHAQVDGDVYRYSSAAKVTGYNGKEKKLAWSGGLNNPQFAVGDLNNDGIKDMVIYENYVGLRTFIGISGKTYRYDPTYEKNFGYVSNYVKLLDYDRDGVTDLVTYGLGVPFVVRKGYYVNNVLNFGADKEVKYKDGNNIYKCYTGSSQVPGVEDVDGDGDIDFIGFDVANGESLTFYRNCQVEEGLPKDSIKICIADLCWGKTMHNTGHISREIRLNRPCGTISLSGRVTCKPSKVTGGVTNLCFLDYDGDGDYESLAGHETFAELQLAINGRVETGHPVDSMIAQDTTWGGANGRIASAPYQPAAFWVDIDNDNDKDIIVTPLAKNGENYKSVLYYENTGGNINPKPNFVYRSDTLFIEDMIDMGSISYPVFYDFDKDGLKDLFVGSEGYQTGSGYRSKVAYYKNTTTGGNISFSLQTEDFLGLWSKNYHGIAMAIGDADNDTLDDLIIGHTDGTFSFYKNTAASATVAPVWTFVNDNVKDATTNTTLDVGDYATPVLYDVDKDGFLDLVSGNQYGDLYYFRGYSVPGGVSFKRINTNLGKVKLERDNVSYGFSAPYIGKVDDSGKDYLMVGSYWGRILRFDGIAGGDTTAKYTMLDSFYSYIEKLKVVSPAFANLDNDAQGLHEMVFGTELGGLYFYKQDFKVSASNILAGDLDIKIYPNPAKDIVNISWGKSIKDGNVTIQLVSVTGQLIEQATYTDGRTAGTLSIGNIPSGVYYCAVTVNGSKSVRPVSILK